MKFFFLHDQRWINLEQVTAAKTIGEGKIRIWLSDGQTITESDEDTAGRLQQILEDFDIRLDQQRDKEALLARIERLQEGKAANIKDIPKA